MKEDIIVLVAEQEELKLVKKLKDLGVCPYLFDNPTIVVTGVGALNVIKTIKMLNLSPNTRIVNVGYGGSKNLKPNFYEISMCKLYHPNVDYPEPTYYGLYSLDWWTYESIFDSVTCYSGSDFVLKTEKEDVIFDMELAYICAMLSNTDIPITAIKYVSDNLDLQQYRNQLKNEEEIKNEEIYEEETP